MSKVSPEQTAIYQKNFKDKQRRLGLCLECMRPNDGTILCTFHREADRLRDRERNRSLRKAVLAYYGQVCACCGESEERFLVIDHVNNDGAAHRKVTKGSGYKTYLWIVMNEFPDGFQTLCHNCNMGKSMNGGVCPHVG